MEPVTFSLPSGQPSDDLEVYDAWFHAHGFLPIINKCMVYTLMGGSPTIVIKVYAHFGGFPKHNRNTG